jgi:hypothetical protein
MGHEVDNVHCDRPQASSIQCEYSAEACEVSSRNVEPFLPKKHMNEKDDDGLISMVITCFPVTTMPVVST